jgi:hypothetical protein
MGAHRKLDQRRDDLCADGLRKCGVDWSEWDGSTGVQDSDKSVQNLTDCAHKSSVGGVRKEFIRRAAFVCARRSASKFSDQKKEI